jgi:hypothetical protein
LLLTAVKSCARNKPARAACGRVADLLASPGGGDAMSQGKRDKQFYEQRASDEMARHFLSADYDTRRSAETRATR